ncbi:MAG: hypothetical protein ACQCN6_14845, partial [Candidatus Bathyarchaeia archaeon]
RAACHWLRISCDLALRLPRLCVNLESRSPSFWVKGAKTRKLELALAQIIAAVDIGSNLKNY